jgi:hypothetical protein
VSSERIANDHAGVVFNQSLERLVVPRIIRELSATPPLRRTTSLRCGNRTATPRRSHRQPRALARPLSGPANARPGVLYSLLQRSAVPRARPSASASSARVAPDARCSVSLCEIRCFEFLRFPLLNIDRLRERGEHEPASSAPRARERGAASMSPGPDARRRKRTSEPRASLLPVLGEVPVDDWPGDRVVQGGKR